MVYDYQEQFGVEIHNADIAAMQRELFEYVWNQAKPMKILSDHGGATIEA